MRAIKKIKRIIEQNPQDKASQIFSKLITCLVEESELSLKELYELNSNEFELAIEALEEWRLDRFYMGKAKVFDVAQQALELGGSEK
jgi:type II secretory pathway component PulL